MYYSMILVFNKMFVEIQNARNISRNAARGSQSAPLVCVCKFQNDAVVLIV